MSIALKVANPNDIRPIQVEYPDQAIDELRRRVNATIWPERETVADDSQGVQLATRIDIASSRLILSHIPRRHFSRLPDYAPQTAGPTSVS